MSTLLAALPAPHRVHTGPVAPAAPVQPIISGHKEVPAYLKRSGFIPRRADDFGGGGSFPEIHVAQYPLDMGRADAASRKNHTLAISVDASGQATYDALLQQGSNKGKVIHSEHGALVPKVDRLTNEFLAKPDDESVEKTVKATQDALDKVLQNKLAVINPAKLPTHNDKPEYIKYTPAQQGPQYASGAGQRIIKMHEMPLDPLEPPKFRHTKVPRGPGSPPVPVMHSPPRPVTAQDQANWKIPPCISNWKNAKGFTIPLDKRLAADGRGLQQSVINDKFAGLSEALFMAEAKAREAITMRAQVQKELLAKEKAKKEAELRELAMRARAERAGGLAGRLDTGTVGSGLPPPPPLSGATGYGGTPARGGGGGGHAADMSDEELPPPPPRPGVEESSHERDARQKRDEIREERRRERERERRLESRDAHVGKKSKITRDRDRDISEKVALGMANVNAGEVMYDQRLFNQDQGMASGFGADDSYSTYDKALFADRSAAGGLYKPKSKYDDDDEAPAADKDVRTDKFKADRGFKGADISAGPRSAPVEFERHAQGGRESGRDGRDSGRDAGRDGGRADRAETGKADEADPFGLDQFLSNVKKGRGNALDSIGGAGSMKAAGGGSSLDDQAGGGSGRRMQFTKERG
mmetsp:Transcript_9135/g.15981  ORF Transcript_9135/g.15981 Transcript_9135/m.15981 type:complete len:641 (-) Transcript_9135:637-2559(-)